MKDEKGQMPPSDSDSSFILPPSSFDVVLMDVQMPEVDGFEATAAIREGEKGTGRHTPILALTAHAMKDDRERCLQAGMDGYIAKPIRSEELDQALQDLVPAAPGLGGGAAAEEGKRD